jgi:predicted phosphate transport protein (TIGR00153 family)
MRTPLLRLFRESPFDKLLLHAEKVQQGARELRQAVECYMDGNWDEFEGLHLQVTRFESEADAIKRNIRGHLPRGIMMPVDKPLFLWYLRAQDKVMDAIQDTLHWLSYRNAPVPDPLADDLLFLVDKAAEAADQLPLMVKCGMQYFRSYSGKDREGVKEMIRAIRQKENESDQIERKLFSDIFVHTVSDPVSIFHLVRLVEIIGEISNNAENAADMMRAMIAR